MTKPIKIVVTGAAGQLSYALLFKIASGEMFGKDIRIDLRLLETEQFLQKLYGIVMELEDCAIPLLENLVYTSDLKTAMQDANWVLLIGAKPRQKGMQRSDLLQINGLIFKEQGKAINDYAAENVHILVVGNPCNTNCLIAMYNAPDIPYDRFYAITALDERRAVAKLALKAGVPITAIKRMTIWGNHSATLYPDFYNTRIHDRPVTEIISDQAWLKEDFITMAQQRGAEIIKLKGTSSAASAANAILYNIQNLIQDTKEDNTFSMAKCSIGEYSIDEGLIFSFPCQISMGQLKVATDFEHNDFARIKIQATLEELRQEKEIAKQLGFIRNSLLF